MRILVILYLFHLPSISIGTILVLLIVVVYLRREVDKVWRWIDSDLLVTNVNIILELLIYNCLFEYNVYIRTFPKNACIIMGNEANGISKEVESYIQHRITIPRFGIHQKTESLNVATATAILLNECKRSEYM